MPNQKLVFTWIWAQGDMAGVQSLVPVALAPRPGGTELTLTHCGLPAAKAIESHATGWQSSWECLDNALIGKPKVPAAQPLLAWDPNVMCAFGVMAERPSFAATMPPMK